MDVRWRRYRFAAFFLTIIAGLLVVSCGPDGTVEEQQGEIRDLVESTLLALLEGDGSDLGADAPELAAFSRDEIRRLSATIAEIGETHDISWEIDTIEIRGAKAYARVHFTRDPEDTGITVVLPFQWIDDGWAITPDFSFEQRIDYVPIE